MNMPPIPERHSAPAEKICAPAPFLDVTAPQFSFTSSEVAIARERHWYAESPLGIVVLRHRQASELLRDRRFEPAGSRYMAMHGITSGPVYDWWMNMIQSVSRADHARLRSLVNAVFTVRSVERLRPFIRAIAQQLAQKLAAKGECEFMDAFADPLPVWTMCQLLGVPTEDYEQFRRWSTDVGLVFSRDLPAVLPTVEAAIVGLSQYAERLLTKPRRPHAGLIANLIELQTRDQRLGFQELHNLVVTLVFGGHDQTARMFGRAMIVFSEHPDQWTLLGQTPELAAQAAEEVLRWSPTAQIAMRYALEDVEYGELLLSRGTLCMICVPAANRDPRAFENPDRFDITVPRNGRQVTFGGGAYHCLGAPIARLELTEGLFALASALSAPLIAGPVVWRHPAAIIHGPDVLPLRFTAAGATFEQSYSQPSAKNG